MSYINKKALLFIAVNMIAVQLFAQDNTSPGTEKPPYNSPNPPAKRDTIRRRNARRPANKKKSSDSVSDNQRKVDYENAGDATIHK